MSLTLMALLVIFGFFAAMFAFIELGRRIGIRRLARDPEGGLAQGAGAAEAAVFALMGLLLAFTFSGAAGRFEVRRHLIADETNAIGTAWLRLDLLPAASQPELRNLFRRYTTLRATIYHNAENMASVRAKLTEAANLQTTIWQKAQVAARAPEAHADAMKLLVPALNDMFDITTTRLMGTQNHPPMLVFILLFGLALGGATLLGYDMSVNKKRSRLHGWIFAAAIGLAVYSIIDLEFPRMGFIRVDSADQLMIDLAESFGPVER